MTDLLHPEGHARAFASAAFAPPAEEPERRPHLTVAADAAPADEAVPAPAEPAGATEPVAEAAPTAAVSKPRRSRPAKPAAPRTPAIEEGPAEFDPGVLRGALATKIAPAYDLNMKGIPAELADRLSALSREAGALTGQRKVPEYKLVIGALDAALPDPSDETAVKEFLMRLARRMPDFGG